ncbi:DUF6266 family protein [Pedobacter frigoris]|uniref:DUF6266 family protein n=1 Tax=Pedobacter frigoris TaxID=2571272 RepID=UPI00292D6B25|nr:DUF6266 family protein [Pedobacter frigoris]
MGILKQGVFGEVSGRIGNKVYYMLRGELVGRMIGRNVKPPSIKQLANRQRMKVVIEFLKPIQQFIQMGFGLEAAKRNVYPHNAAVGYNKKYALQGEFPEIEIDYEKVLLSKGTLIGLTDVSVRIVGNEEDGVSLWFDWVVSPEDRDWPRCNDQVMLMAYFPEEVDDYPACYNIAGAKRQAGQDVLVLPLYIEGKPMEVYIAVITEMRSDVSDSQYLGRVMT